MIHISKALGIALAKGVKHVYPRMEKAILSLLPKHSLNGATPDRGGRHLTAADYSFIDPKGRKAKLAWLVNL